MADLQLSIKEQLDWNLDHLIGTDMRGRYTVYSPYPTPDGNYKCPDCGESQAWDWRDLNTNSGVWVQSEIDMEPVELVGYEYDCGGSICFKHYDDEDCREADEDYELCDYDGCYRMITLVPLPVDSTLLHITETTWP